MLGLGAGLTSRLTRLGGLERVATRQQGAGYGRHGYAADSLRGAEVSRHGAGDVVCGVKQAVLR